MSRIIESWLISYKKIIKDYQTNCKALDEVIFLDGVFETTITPLIWLITQNLRQYVVIFYHAVFAVIVKRNKSRGPLNSENVNRRKKNLNYDQFFVVLWLYSNQWNLRKVWNFELTLVRFQLREVIRRAWISRRSFRLIFDET